MAKLTILYWRDIPAEILIREGRKRNRAELDPRFADAIDRAAMACGARDSDAYLDGWRHGSAREVSGDLETIAMDMAVQLSCEFPPDKLNRMIENAGVENV